VTSLDHLLPASRLLRKQTRAAEVLHFGFCKMTLALPQFKPE